MEIYDKVSHIQSSSVRYRPRVWQTDGETTEESDPEEERKYTGQNTVKLKH